MAKSDPTSAEAINTKLRGGIASGFDKGPAQTKYMGMGEGTLNAVKDLRSTAGQNDGILQSAFNYNQGLLNSGGLTDSQTANMGLVNNLAQTSGAGNPHVDDIIKQTNDNTYADVMASLGSSGMTGSNIHVNELGNALAENESRLRYDDYNQGFNRQMNAANAGFGMAQAGTANAMGAADRSGGLFQNTLMPAQMRIQAGSLLDADNRAKAAFDPQYEHLLKYQGLLGNNAAGPQPAKKPGFMDYLGLGAGLLTSFV